MKNNFGRQDILQIVNDSDKAFREQEKLIQWQQQQKQKKIETGQQVVQQNNLNNSTEFVGMSQLQQILRNYEKENNNEDIFEPFFEIYERNPKLFGMGENYLQQDFNSNSQKYQQNELQQQQWKMYNNQIQINQKQQHVSGVFDCQYNEYNSYKIQNFQEQKEQSINSQMQLFLYNQKKQNYQNQQENCLKEKNETTEEIKQQTQLQKSRSVQSLNKKRKPCYSLEQEEEEFEPSYSDSLFEEQGKIKNKRQNAKKQVKKSQDCQKIQKKNQENNNNKRNQNQGKKNNFSQPVLLQQNSEYSDEMDSELKKQIKITRKNLWKNIGRQFFQHLQRDKIGVQTVLNKFGVKDSQGFLKLYTPKKMKIMNKEQFLKFFYPNIPFDLQEKLILEKSKSGKNLSESEEEFLHKKILRILVYKFVNEQLFQHCTQESRIRNWSCFLSQKYYFLYSILRINKQDLMVQLQEQQQQK
ncbi:hypothetical protein PPERSA_00146 [Pseudocohnilembus persalinus]|uniref:Uncharacterized protein n=1 Tax=Pseudocohnilembus persalinus TaxID=266149 RepID=A0A0V0QHT2_PSEPJ|nr:hypothetical protein PPERSA_00146 [Pseudocohnilembus persalinus]|eukprot:KRX01773.1 hypothetical protein PPERSA_00146 [Pseudocohnilembus persalinus]